MIQHHSFLLIGKTDTLDDGTSRTKLVVSDGGGQVGVVIHQPPKWWFPFTIFKVKILGNSFKTLSFNKAIGEAKLQFDNWISLYRNSIDEFNAPDIDENYLLYLDNTSEVGTC